ncbi:hypothetical protein SISNIDRAFT_466728 [Sistotremastrum niveocremeum HHB9708]|uniref:Uncharacterized protein n=1 Tax=Sistotremastrum niveocremeum HHB9708 TaxID=1314777 RepID=A0A164U2V6_9AGAM|nr:hypothetical protein SISNIDRAFT_466728 [Sistotremastrum niveocremeum HHB9708]
MAPEPSQPTPYMPEKFTHALVLLQEKALTQKFNMELLTDADGPTKVTANIYTVFLKQKEFMLNRFANSATWPADKMTGIPGAVQGPALQLNVIRILGSRASFENFHQNPLNSMYVTASLVAHAIWYLSDTRLDTLRPYARLMRDAIRAHLHARLRELYDTGSDHEGDGGYSSSENSFEEEDKQDSKWFLERIMLDAPPVEGYQYQLKCRESSYVRRMYNATNKKNATPRQDCAFRIQDKATDIRATAPSAKYSYDVSADDPSLNPRPGQTTSAATVALLWMLERQRFNRQTLSNGRIHLNCWGFGAAGWWGQDV